MVYKERSAGVEVDSPGKEEQAQSGRRADFVDPGEERVGQSWMLPLSLSDKLCDRQFNLIFSALICSEGRKTPSSLLSLPAAL